MREKHPDGESACGYCLAGQQHPRLARGESYTCGYKPYRCEICNYSTTTKGNLSIHMQSDKHLNNMQELNSAGLSQQQTVHQQHQSNTVNQNSQNGLLKSIPTSPTSIQQLQSKSPPNTVTSIASSSSSVKPKPNFRCEVCSYDTNVARNLRIHMTSEKHTHNMVVLQNNLKHLHALSILQNQQQLPTTPQQNNQQLNLTIAANLAMIAQQKQVAAALQQQQQPPNTFLPEAALADFAYNQALMIQILNSQQQQQQIQSKLVSTPPLVLQQKQLSLDEISVDPGLNPDIFEPPVLELNQNPAHLFACCVCQNYETNSLDELNLHTLQDRYRNANSGVIGITQGFDLNQTDVTMIIGSNYICRLCNYKTALKANFQLHSKTDKHLQKLNFLQHIKDGGPKVEFKLKYLNNLNGGSGTTASVCISPNSSPATSPGSSISGVINNGNVSATSNLIQLRCCACDWYTNSIQKLILHTQTQKHDSMKLIFHYLLNSIGTALESDSYKNEFICELCQFKTTTIIQLIQHIKSQQHQDIEEVICQQRQRDKLENLELLDVFKVNGFSSNCKSGWFIFNIL